MSTTDHTEAITLHLHDASPQHLVEEMSDDAVLELGWGRLIFGQTFTDPDKLAAVLQQEVHGRRDICIYAPRVPRAGGQIACGAVHRPKPHLPVAAQRG